MSNLLLKRRRDRNDDTKINAFYHSYKDMNDVYFQTKVEYVKVKEEKQIENNVDTNNENERPIWRSTNW